MDNSFSYTIQHIGDPDEDMGVRVTVESDSVSKHFTLNILDESGEELAGTVLAERDVEELQNVLSMALDRFRSCSSDG